MHALVSGLELFASEEEKQTEAVQDCPEAEGTLLWALVKD